MAANSRVPETRHLSHNTRDAPLAFTLGLATFPLCSAKSPELVGRALETNRTISYLYIPTTSWPSYDICNVDIQGILSFVANNPFLRVLELNVANNEDACKIVRQILVAASRNAGIQKIELRDGSDALFSTDEMMFSDNIRDIELSSCSQQFLGALPRHHRLSSLSLRESLDDTLSTLIERSIIVQNLQLSCWTPNLPFYLASPQSYVETLGIMNGEFQGHQMEQLVRGLIEGNSVTALQFHSCEFDRRAMEELKTALGSSLTSVKSLCFTTFDTNLELQRDDFQTFLGYSHLETLGFEWHCVPGMPIDIIAAGLQAEASSLSTFKISTNDLVALAPSLKIALTLRSLTTLRLSGSHFGEEEVKCLVDLIQDEECHLLTLELCNWCGPAMNSLGPRTISALKGKVNLRTLVLKREDIDAESPSFEGVIDALCCSLPAVESLTDLQFLTDSSLSLQMEEEVAGALEKNWSLESLLFVDSWYSMMDRDDRRYRRPETTAAFKQKADKFCIRNKLKKEIFTDIAEPVSARGKMELMEKLESFWVIPNGLSLAFWLLEHVPGALF